MIIDINTWYATRSLFLEPTEYSSNDKPLFMTRYPSYLVYQSNGAFNTNQGMNIDGLEKKKEQEFTRGLIKQYSKQQELLGKRGYESAFETIDGWEEEYKKKNKKKPSVEDKKEKIFHVLVPMIQKLSRIPIFDASGVGGGLINRAMKKQLKVEQSVRHIQITSLKDPGRDGEATVRIGTKEGTLSSLQRYIRIIFSFWGATPKSKYVKDPVSVAAVGQDFGVMEVLTKKQHKNTSKPPASSWQLVDDDHDSSSDDLDDSEGWWLSPPQGIETIRANGTGPCHFVSSRVHLEPDAADGVVVQIPDGHVLSPFVLSLRDRLFTLAAEPKANPQGLFDATPFDDLDDWQCWFRGVFPATDSPCRLALTPAVWPLKPDSVFQFSLALKLFDQFPVVLDTAAAVGLFPPVTRDGLQAMLESRATMVFGLADKTEAFKTRLELVASFVGFSKDTTPALGLLQDLELTLDVPKPKGAGSEEPAPPRNAVWFRPCYNYETVARLQFRAPHEKLNDWLKDTFGGADGMQIKRLVVVAKKTSYHRLGHKQDGIEARGELVFHLGIAIGSLDFEATLRIGQETVLLSITNMTKGANILGAILGWFEAKLDVKGLELDHWLRTAGGDTGVANHDSIVPRRVEVEVAVDEKGHLKQVTRAAITLEACLTIGKPDAADDPHAAAAPSPVFELVFGWARGGGASLTGSLWCGELLSRNDYR